MTIKQLYERVSGIVTTTNQNSFVSCFNECTDELSARYGERDISRDGDEVFPIKSVNEVGSVHKYYIPAMRYGILASLTGDATMTERFWLEADKAYRQVWNERTKRRRVMRRERW
jgi:hypothetical protein